MNKVVANVFLTFVLVALCAAGLFFFNRAAAPYPKVLPVEGAVLPDYEAIISTVTEDGLREDLEALCVPSSRFSGTPGCDQAADYIAARLRALGYKVLEQPLSVTVPLTRHARILDERGREIEGIRIYPMLPNWFRTVTTTPEGLRGKVYRGEKGLAREFRDVNLQGNFVLLPVGTPWNTVAGMGAGAVLYFDDGSRRVGAKWSHNVNASFTLPRFFVTGDAAALEGKTVTISARVDFAECTVRNIVAILEAPGSHEAVIVDTYYDSYSYVPDLAPGAQQACSAAVFLSVAEHLIREAHELKRAVVLVATAGHGQGLFGIREFTRALGACDRRPKSLEDAVSAPRDVEDELELAGSALAVAGDPAYWSACGEDAETAYWGARSEDLKEYFYGLLAAALDLDMMEAVEEVTRCRVGWVRENMPVHDEAGGDARSFTAYNEARKRQERVQAVLSIPAGKLKKQWTQYLSDHNIPSRVKDEGKKNIETLARRLLEAEARARLAENLARYERVLFLGIDLTSRSGRIGLACGETDAESLCMPADAEIASQLRRAGERLNEVSFSSAETTADEADDTYVETRGGLPRIVNLLRKSGSSSLGFTSGSSLCFESSAPLWAGHTALTLATLDDNRRWAGTPSDTLDKVLEPALETSSQGDKTPLEELCVSARLVTAAVSQWGLGHGQIVENRGKSDLYTVKGRVVSQIGDNLTPDHAMPGAIVRFGPAMCWGMPVPVPLGVGSDFCLTADREGKFELAGIWGTALSGERRKEIDIDAAVVRPEDGEITWSLSTPKSGPQAQFRVRRVEIAQYNKSLAMPVVFRSAPVQVVPMSDPATLRPYPGFSFIETKSMAMPQGYKVEMAGGNYVCFVPPETSLYFTFKKGTINNPNLMQIRAFALGATGPADGLNMEYDSEISGKGYFAADTPSIVNIEIDAALSVAQVNSRRTKLQQRYNMADEMILAYNRKAIALAEEARNLAEKGGAVAAKRTASESLAYGSNIHPVIRKNASDAIVGILFYLMLAIPFAIFMEKLLVGHPDLRVQIAVQSVIFILFFLALRAVHPAYQLVRSSYMILLGFITFALAVIVGIFVANRFSQNITDLQQRLKKRVEVADVSRTGAAMAAFILGLSHMRKRPVRTGLTVMTLILTTFVMLCFTSVRTDLVDIEFALGKASYTGLLIRDRQLKDVSAALAPLRELYGEDHVVARRDWAGKFDFGDGSVAQPAEYSIIRNVGEQSYEATANAILGLSLLEPRATSITNAFRTLNRWFESDVEESCFLPRFLADQLYVEDADVAAGTAKVIIAGRKYTVLGIFDADRLSTVLDVDGQSLLPVDILSLRTPDQAGKGARTEEATEIPEDVPRLPGRDVVITPAEAMPVRTRTASIAVAFQGLDYAAARELITSHLERSAEPAYYGLDGVAFYGGRFRMQSLEGILDLLLPIVIAALTVLNTLRGSVYERRDELYVFNAVGLSPSHIRSLFVAEASVYAVVGAVGGYILAQGVGTGLRFLGLTGGLTMNYSSLSCVFVSLVIMLVVFVSSIFPARMAARLAAPAETMTRERHTATGDVMEIDLPFTFNHRDRVAIIPFFIDWFENYGEASSGEYFCSVPEYGVKAEQHEGAAPFVRTTTWLKPYDLAVSQAVELVVRHMPDSGDNVATVLMTRKSGDKESWERCCHAFIGLLRKRFLNWRAVPDDARSRLLERGRELLKNG